MTLRRLAPFAPLALIASLALAACVPPAPEPTPVPTPTPTPVATRAPLAPPPAPMEFANWMDAPATPGDWHYRAAGADRIAEFRSPAGGQIFQMICTAERDMMLAVIARVPAARAITIRTETTTRALNADAMESSVATMLGANDPLLEAMAFSKGRFAVEIAGGPQLFLPAYPEVTRVIEACRS